jgi:hypothetical protein
VLLWLWVLHLVVLVGWVATRAGVRVWAETAEPAATRDPDDDPDHDPDHPLDPEQAVPEETTTTVGAVRRSR